MKKYYRIEYVSQDNVNFTNNALHSAIESKLFVELMGMHGIELETDLVSNVRCTRN